MGPYDRLGIVRPVPPLSTAEDGKMMDVEEYLGRSELFRRLKCGPHGELVERYAVRLVGERLVQHGTWRCLNVVSGLLAWT
jgi:hypothetical protein